MSLKSFSFVLGLSLLTSASFAAVDQVPRNQAEMGDYSMYELDAVRVTTTKVVIADYDLIAHDFPEMVKKSGESEPAWKSRVDAWLIDQTAFIAKAQTAPNDVNTPIQTSAEGKVTHRPHGYNRAHLITTGSGMMDAKGVGTTNPRQRHHGNGLGSLGEMIREYMYEKLVSNIFEHSSINAKTVGCYAVMDYGFDVINDDHSRSRAGYVLRQNHVRSSFRNSGLGLNEAFEVEKVLRKYGVTSSGETFAAADRDTKAGRALQYNFDYTNIQGTNNTKTIEVIDFGAFLTVDKFERALVSHHEYAPLATLGSKDFIQPDPAVRVPLEQWSGLGFNDPKSDKPWIWSHELAQAWAEGRAQRQHVEQHLHNLLDPAIGKMRAAGTLCGRVFSN